jgi:HAMP domain-containing protein
MPADLTPLANQFALVVVGLRGMLAAYMPRADRTRPVLLLLWKRLGQLNRRIATLTQRLAEGRPVAPRPQPRPAAETTDVPLTQRATSRARLCLPNKPGWLVDQTIQAAPYANYFRQLIDQPEMTALLDAYPQLKRQLRPILRLLMVDLPPILALPPRPPRPPRLKPPRVPRPKKPRRAPCHGARRPKEFWRPGPIRPLWTA